MFPHPLTQGFLWSLSLSLFLSVTFNVRSMTRKSHRSRGRKEAIIARASALIEFLAERARTLAAGKERKANWSPKLIARKDGTYFKRRRSPVFVLHLPIIVALLLIGFQQHRFLIGRSTIEITLSHYRHCLLMSFQVVRDVHLQHYTSPCPSVHLISHTIMGASVFPLTYSWLLAGRAEFHTKCRSDI